MASGLDVLVVLACGRPYLTRELAAELHTTTGSIAGIAACLKRKDYISSAEGVHSITERGRLALGEPRKHLACKGLAAQSAAGLRHRAWRAMQMMTAFDVDSLLDVVATGAEKDAAGNIRSYLRALYRVDMLIKTRSGKYLLRETAKGANAPSYNRSEKTVTDRNTGEVMYVR